jgi:hypothetical protein
MAELKYKHFFKVENGKFIFEDKEMLDFVRKNLEGKRGYALIEEVKKDVSNDQYAYYFGGIIRKECMVSETFAGMKETEVHGVLMMETGFMQTVTFDHPVKGRVIYQIPEDIKKWSMKKMAGYIQQVIALLNTEYHIYPKPASHYKYNRFYMDPKKIDI